MKKTVWLACLLCALPLVANAWPWSRNNSKNDAAVVENNSKPAAPASRMSKNRMRSLPVAETPVDTDSEKTNKKEEKTDREKLIEGAYGTKGSANLLRLQSDSANRGRNNIDAMRKKQEKTAKQDTVESMKARSEKYKEQYEADKGIPLDEMEAYYSSHVGVEKDKKLEQVYDPLDKR